MDKIGKYVIQEPLGQGGMGVIYKALDPDINREVAVKTIRNELFLEGVERNKILKQFTIEAQAAGRLNHPNIATIYEIGREGDMTYIVMQYVRGRSLRKVIEQEKQLAPEAAVKLLAPVCDALECAHRSGIVHRDVKPDNILIDEEGRPYLVDFGIATIESVHLTRVTTASATPAYTSPEQILEEKIDHRADIFALGIILFEMLSGRRPFAGTTLYGLSQKIVSEPPARLDPENTAPAEGLEAVIQKALAKKPDDRHQSCAELAAAMQEAVRSMEQTTVLGETRSGPRSVVTTRTWRPVRRSWIRRQLDALSRNKWKAAAVLAVVLCAAAAAFAPWRLLTPQCEYEALVAILPFQYNTPDTPQNLIEFALDRTLSAATTLPVFVQTDTDFWTKQADVKKTQCRLPRVRITGAVNPTVTGYEIVVRSAYKGEEREAVFPCKGHLDFVSTKINDIVAFCAADANGDIGKVSGGRAFAQICTSNWDALSHFLKGKNLWEKLETETAHAEFKTAIENDPDFGLALLKLAEVKVFRGDRENARTTCEAALKRSKRLIDYDLWRLQALVARLESKPREERSHLMKLTEAFPLKKEYLYDFAESYFHCGDGEEAIPYYSRALELDPNYALAHNHIAFCYAWTGNHAKAEEHFLKYVALDNTANSYDSLASGYLFAGRHDKALEALEKGRQLSPTLDYLFGNFASNYELLGALRKSADNLTRQLEVSTRENTAADVAFQRAYLALLRGDLAAAETELQIARAHYSAASFSERVDESPILPFWLTGVIASQQKNLPLLKETIARLDRKVARHGVNASNYFPVLKFAIHLKVLQGKLNEDMTAVRQNVEEGERIRTKMGYWSSPFNLAYFLDQYAGVLLDMGSAADQAGALLNEVTSYNPTYAPTLVKLARVRLAEGKPEEARKQIAQARQVLAQADPELLLLKELTQIEQQIGSN